MTRRYCVDGHEFDSPDSPLTGDGAFAPFYVFDIEEQDWKSTPYVTHEEAQTEADRLNEGGY